MGLNESYAHTRGQTLMLNPLPPINTVFFLVVQEERQKEVYTAIGSSNHNSAALFTKSVASDASATPRNRPVKNNSFRKDRPVCSHCGVSGHTMEKCYRLHGFPPGFKFNKGKNDAESSANQVSDFFETSGNQISSSLPFTQEQCQKLMTLITPSSEVSSANHLVANMSGNSFMPNTAPNFLHSVFSSITSFKKALISNSCSWIINTGATDHMICSFSLFTTVIASVSKLVKLPNGNFVPVTHIGTVRLSSTLILTNVLYVPSFSFNLISVSQLTKNVSCCLLFFANTCYIQHLHPWKTIGVGRESGGLFHL